MPSVVEGLGTHGLGAQHSEADRSEYISELGNRYPSPHREGSARCGYTAYVAHEQIQQEGRLEEGGKGGSLIELVTTL
jgi:hypothetical protein